MKVFWSWQSDTPGKAGRHLVRDALEAAIASLKQGDEIEEPAEREVREALHLDHDRKGVSGTPDLANTIFDKIRAAAVFVADVTLVGESRFSDANGNKKMFINSNVAIEYGFARQCVTDGRILLVQNVHYGNRDQLPFDLKNKISPIQFSIDPDVANKAEIARVQSQLTRELSTALSACFRSVVIAKPEFQQTQSTSRPAYFWKPGETLAILETGFRHRLPEDDPVHFTFNEPHALYLRLIPTAPLPTQLPNRKLLAIGQSRQVAVLTRRSFATDVSINSYGVGFYEASGPTSTSLVALTQLFQNGEIWSVSGELIITNNSESYIPATNLRNILSLSLHNFGNLAATHLGVLPSYSIEFGAIGLRGLRLTGLTTWPYQNLTKQIQADDCCLMRVAEITETTVPVLVAEFMRRLYDLVGIEYVNS